MKNMKLDLITPSGLTHSAEIGAIDAADNPRWLILSPHDDDAVLGCGILVNLAIRAGIPVHILVVSDGRLGFSKQDEWHNLAQRRQTEMDACAAALNTNCLQQENLAVSYLGYPDGKVQAMVHAAIDDTGHLSGLLPDLCERYRTFRPTTIFAPTPTDLHPDHQAVSAAADIVGFHASAGIWQHLGEPLPEPPQRIDYAVYCPFESNPDIRLTGDAVSMHAKRAGIEAFASQPAIIASLLQRLDESGPVECLRRRPWPAYQARDYDDLFVDNPNEVTT